MATLGETSLEADSEEALVEATAETSLGATLGPLGVELIEGSSQFEFRWASFASGEAICTLSSISTRIFRVSRNEVGRAFIVVAAEDGVVAGGAVVAVIVEVEGDDSLSLVRSM